jgi:uncharacterized protein YdhG (YjbR/CyaY superfamily)
MPSPKRDDRGGELMESREAGLKSIDEYIAAFPEEIQKTLQKLRATIKTSAPDAEERISYQIPTFFLNGNLVHFAAYKKHIGFYPTSSAIRVFKHFLATFKDQPGGLLHGRTVRSET